MVALDHKYKGQMRREEGQGAEGTSPGSSRQTSYPTSRSYCLRHSMKQDLFYAKACGDRRLS